MNDVCGGRGYHMDATWGQRQPGENLLLHYFMQTDEERKADGMDTDKKRFFTELWGYSTCSLSRQGTQAGLTAYVKSPRVTVNPKKCYCTVTPNSIYSNYSSNVTVNSKSGYCTVIQNTIYSNPTCNRKGCLISK